MIDDHRFTKIWDRAMILIIILQKIKSEALPTIFLYRYLNHVRVESHLSESEWVKKETKITHIYHISHFATKVRRCSESNLICLSQIWVKKETSTQKGHFSQSNGHFWHLTQIVCHKSYLKLKKSYIWGNSDNLNLVKTLFWMSFVQNIARIANAVQVTICLLVSTSVY